MDDGALFQDAKLISACYAVLRSSGNEIARDDFFQFYVENLGYFKELLRRDQQLTE